MSAAVMAIIFGIPLVLVVGILKLSVSGSRTLVAYGRDKIDEIRKSTSGKEASDFLKRAEKILKVGTDIRAEEFAPDDYQDFCRELMRLSKIPAKVSSLKELNQIKDSTKALVERGESMVIKACKEAEREAVTRISVEVLGRMGFKSEVIPSANGQLVSIFAKGHRKPDGAEKLISIVVDSDNRIRADFSGGYKDYAPQECHEDALRFFAELRKLGAELSVDMKSKPPTSRKGGNAQQLNLKQPQAKSTMGS